jgi:hypothetical protein
MGWSFEWHDRGRKAFIESLTGAKHFSEGYEPLEHRVVGNNVWQLVLHKATNRKFICLDLIAKARGEGWGYKGLSEDMGPVEVNCPLSLLNKADPPMEGYAVEWRERVRAYHARRAAVAKPKPGMVVKYGEYTYKLIEQWAPRKGWKVIQVETGTEYRMKARQLSQALRSA